MVRNAAGVAWDMTFSLLLDGLELEFGPFENALPT